MSFLTRIEKALEDEPRGYVTVTKRDLEELVYHFNRIDSEMRTCKMMENLNIAELKEVLYEIDSFASYLLDENGMYDKVNSNRLRLLHGDVCRILKIWDKVYRED